MASAPTSSARGAGGSAQEPPQEGSGSLIPLAAYFGVMLLLLLAFIVIGFIAVSAPLPARIAFVP
jgi:hypothetical protein